MRAFELFEDDNNHEQIAQYIVQHCQPWLSKAGQNNLVFRGMKKLSRVETTLGDGVAVVAVNHNRQPRDSSPVLHNALNTIIGNHHLIANRSNSVFVTGNLGQAVYYGTPYVIIPVGDFHFTWNTMIRDAYAEWNKNKADYAPDLENPLEYAKQHANEAMLKNEAINILMRDRELLTKVSPEANKRYEHQFDDMDDEELFSIANSNVHPDADQITSREEAINKLFDDPYQLNITSKNEFLREIVTDIAKEKLAKKDPDLMQKIYEVLANFFNLDHKHHSSEIELQKLDNKIGKFYTDKNLKKAISSGNEIMVHCKAYVAIDDENIYKNTILPLMKKIR